MHSSSLSADDHWPAFAAAARRLVAEQGLPGLSLRRLARASGWTLGEIGYRLGRKEQILDRLIASETAAQREVDTVWLNRFSGHTRLDATSIAQLAGHWLDEQTGQHRLATIFRGEILQARIAASDIGPTKPATSTCNDPYQEQLKSRTSFWEELLTDRHPEGARLARLLANFLFIEQYYALTLGHHTDYRLLRDFCLRRLCHGLLATSQSPDTRLFTDLANNLSTSPEITPDTNALTDKAREVATVAGALLGEQGAGAVTHRAVAARAGRSVSAITHHFPTHVELLQNAYEALHRQITAEVEAGYTPKLVPATPTDLPVPARTGTQADYPGLALLRTNVLLLLEAARTPNYLPFVARQRARRGGYSRLWAIGHFVGQPGFDACAAQISSITIEGELLAMLACGLPYDGRSARALGDLIALGRQHQK